jgi:uncharacterized membrane protein YraQ (UPF0718 family)
MMNRFKRSAGKSVRAFINILPIVFGMLLLTSLMISVFPKQLSTDLFGKSDFLDALLGATFGGIATGHPVVSYVLGGELLSSGISLFAVTALIVSWVTVGIVQLPAEALLLGKRFALYRNLTCYLLAIVIALLTVYTLQLLAAL